MSVPVAGGLGPNDLKGSFQCKPFYDTMLSSCLSPLKTSKIFCLVTWHFGLQALRGVLTFLVKSLIGGTSYILRRSIKQKIQQNSAFRYEVRLISGISACTQLRIYTFAIN